MKYDLIPKLDDTNGYNFDRLVVDGNKNYR